jgi:hypothetical protein
MAQHSGPQERKADIKSQPHRIHLLVWGFAGVVLVLEVGVELHMLSHREQRTHIKSSGTPFAILALVRRLGGDIRDEVIGADRKSSSE